MFELEITLQDIDCKHPVITALLSGKALAVLKNEVSKAILDCIHESGCYYINITVSEDGEYCDADEFTGFIDVENQLVTQTSPEAMNMQMPLYLSTSNNTFIASGGTAVNEPVSIYNRYIHHCDSGFIKTQNY